MKLLKIVPFVLAAFLASGARAQSELEATLQSVDPVANTIRVLGMTIDCSTAAIHTLGGVPLTLAQCNGAPLPGGSTNGYVGGTVFVTSQMTQFGPVASDVVMTTPETVLIGEVTRNEPGVGPGGRAFAVFGVEVQPAVDARLDPFQALINGLDLDVSSVPLGSVVALEGYFGVDGRFYAHVLEAEVGQPIGNAPVQVLIARARCKAGQIDAQGSVSRAGTVQLLDDQGRVVAGTPVLADGTWRVRARLAACPLTLRARHVESNTVSAPFSPTP